jgi:hypothetical protein
MGFDVTKRRVKPTRDNVAVGANVIVSQANAARRSAMIDFVALEVVAKGAKFGIVGFYGGSLLFHGN